ncbi:MAG: hypothetical protein A3H29_01225 [Acidobacteria bacterium RIFCSPLOWO2_02_FULL_67_21]|nr:MAG: hypothetical protein A3H29_01225 [Acidobacteria bacterium RIFCSPLOWO2_02_FULL_67_21]
MAGIVLSRGRLLSAAAVLLAAPALAGAQTCESISSLRLPSTTITSAASVAAGALGRAAAALQNLPAFCRVEMTIAPTPDSDITVEVWMPASGWNGKFLAVGNGGWAGSLNTAGLAAGIRRGYATASTDTGHTAGAGGGGGPWMQNREKRVDFGYRAVHETAEKGKAVVRTFYGSAARLAYFDGCSGGGRQGLKAAQRFPADFDGIVAGAPALNATGRAAFAMSIAQTVHADAASFIPSSKFLLIHKAVLDACDARDGVADGVLENPKACAFDPAVLQCTAGDGAACLTPAQVASTRAMYAPLAHARSKDRLFPGLSPGSELGWTTFAGPEPFEIARQMYEFMVFNDPEWNFKALNFDSDMDRVRTIEAGVIDARDPNLAPFAARGGKLIQYHGWADPQIPALSSVEYYESVVKTRGGTGRVHDAYRLFMVPGMGHCGGGSGTSTFDMLGALERWVEQRQPPDRIPAARILKGVTDRTRPLCPYPQVARYTGTGNTDDAANFSCGPP